MTTDTDLPHPIDSASDYLRFLRKFADDPKPSFPVHVLPPVMRTLVLEAAEALPSPAEFVAVPLLVFAGATIGRSRGLRLKEGWTETPVLFAAIVGAPGVAKKTPSIKVAQHPLDVMQAEAMRDYRSDISLPDDQAVIPDHTYTTDATLEAVATMAESSRGFVVIKDELVSWVKSCDAYRGGRGGDRQSWLSLWSSTALKVDRKSAGPLFVPDPRVSVFGGVQPDMLSELSKDGRHDGFLDRILWAWPTPVRDRWTDSSVADTTRDAVLDVFRRLRANKEAVVVTLSPDARNLWRAWYDDNAERTESAGPVLVGVYTKMTAQAARLALILHCMGHSGNPHATVLSVETLYNALTLTEYFRSQARLVMTHLSRSAAGQGESLPITRVEQLLLRADGWTLKTDLHKGLGGHVTSDELDSALAYLESAGRAERRQPIRGSRGRPAEAWRSITNPRINEENEFIDGADSDLAA
jgi:hypothetical protein